MELDDIPVEVVEKSFNHLGQSRTTTVGDIKMFWELSDTTGNYDAGKAVQLLVDTGVVELNGGEIQPGTVVEAVKVEEFRNQIDSKEPFVIETLENDSQRNIAYHFAEWVTNHYQFEAVVFDRYEEQKAIQFWRYDPDERIWRPDGEQKLYELAREQLPGDKFGENLLRELKANVKSMGLKPYDAFGADRGKLPVENGVLDLETGELESVEKDDYLIRKLPVEYDPDAECPRFLEFLQNSTKSEQVRQKLQEYIGYCLMHWTTKYEKAAIIVGPTDSGKSVFADIIRALLGPKNTIDKDIQELTNKTFGKDRLKGKLANINHDLDQRVIENIGMAKKLISGNPITADVKHGKEFTIVPKAKHLYCANELPDRETEDDAFYNRWLTVIFPDQIPEEEKDRQLTEKITGKIMESEELMESDEFEGELPGILNWAISGYKRLEDQEVFTGARSPTETRELWYQWGNIVHRFVMDYCTRKRELLNNTRKTEDEIDDSEFRVSSNHLYEVFQKYARLKDVKNVSQEKFNQEIKKYGGVRKGNPLINGTQQRGFFGIKLKDDVYELLEERAKMEDKELNEELDREETRSDRSKVEDAVSDLSEKHEDGVPYQDLIDYLEVEKQTVERIVDDLKDHGVIYENRPGKLEIL